MCLMFREGEDQFSLLYHIRHFNDLQIFVKTKETNRVTSDPSQTSDRG